jgi:gluconolactonase
MAVQARSPKMLDLIAADAVIERIVAGCVFTEGPVWHPNGGYLLFSDMPGDKRRRWSRAAGVAVVREPANKCNGMTYDAQGNLIVCEHATSTVVREYPDGRRETIASHWQGRELNSPNDVVVGRNGSIYFSDPPWGRLPNFGVERPRQLEFCGVYRIAPEGSLDLATDELPSPNGLCFAPDAALLYINDTLAGHIKAFDVAPDGSLGRGRIFAEGISSSTVQGRPDGMKCDALGNVWVTGPGGLWVFSPAGEHLGVLETPETPSNLAWGGDDWKTLFITARTGVYAVATKVSASREPFMR